MKKFALIGIAALSALMVGCSSTECRDDDSCGMECKDACCMTACDHANSTFKCPNPECSADKPCCADCAKKFSEMCPDCAAKKAAHACPDCKDGKACEKCKA